MTPLTDFHFIRPAWLLLIPLSVGIWWFWQRYADPLHGWRKQISPQLLNALVVNPQHIKLYYGYLAAVLLAIISIAGPTWRLEPNPFADDATPLMILLKADSSMQQPNPDPSRLERAYLKITQLAEARKGQPLGLIAYAGSAHLVLPPTRDTAIVARMAAEISPGIMPVAGDRLDLALTEASRILAKGRHGGSIVIFADTVETETTALHALKFLNDVTVQFLAINSPGSSEQTLMNTAAHLLGANVVSMDIEDHDISKIIRRASSVTVSKSGEQGRQWQEAGYWLVPVLALLVLIGLIRDSALHINDQ